MRCFGGYYAKNKWKRKVNFNGDSDFVVIAIVCFKFGGQYAQKNCKSKMGRRISTTNKIRHWKKVLR